MNCRNESDTGNRRDNWNHPKISQKISEQQTCKAQRQGTTENNHLGTELILRKVLM